jgi:hypothetical protein
MKKITILYWVFTIIFAAGMLVSTIPNIIVSEDSIKFVSGILHYPEYIIFFLGIAKLLGIIGILIPGFPRLKEWSYAGLIFDLTGAVYSLIAIGSPVLSLWPMGLYYVAFAGSYIYYHKRQKLLLAQA